MKCSILWEPQKRSAVRFDVLLSTGAVDSCTSARHLCRSCRASSVRDSMSTKYDTRQWVFTKSSHFLCGVHTTKKRQQTQRAFAASFCGLRLLPCLLPLFAAPARRGRCAGAAFAACAFAAWTKRYRRSCKPRGRRRSPGTQLQTLQRMRLNSNYACHAYSIHTCVHANQR